MIVLQDYVVCGGRQSKDGSYALGNGQRLRFCHCWWKNPFGVVLFVADGRVSVSVASHWVEYRLWDLRQCHCGYGYSGQGGFNGPQAIVFLMVTGHKIFCDLPTIRNTIA